MKNDRLANTVLYLLRGCRDAGLTKLLKLIYHADYHHYRDHLTTITGASYVALERGPVVDGYKDELELLERRGFVTVRNVPIFGHDKAKKEYLPLGEPDPQAFSQAERETLDDVLLRYGTKTGVELSALTHEELRPWELVWDPASPGRPIPYALWRWLDNFVTPREVDVARERSGRLAPAPRDGRPKAP